MQPGKRSPLYIQVRDKLVERIRSGAWKPGQLIPNEFDIADEFDVSQGTARKALTELALDGIVVRRQGLGTFVFEHKPGHAQFRFFYIYDNAQAQIVPESKVAKPVAARANAMERKQLRLEKNARVVRIPRIRTRGGKPFITEVICLPEALFPGLASYGDVPNTLYGFYQHAYGVLVARMDERITAVAADPEPAKALGIPVGAPLLKIDRIAYALDEKPVEWRVSLCHLDKAHYLARQK